MNRDSHKYILDRCKPEPTSGCWLWQRSRNRGGYGMANFAGRRISAHRLSYEAHTGTRPGNMDVCHRCDTPACVNPAHLFLGTAAENMADCQRKGRDQHPLGEAHGNAKLTASAVADIRERRRSGETQSSIARSYGVTQAAISLVTLGRRWRHVEP